MLTTLSVTAFESKNPFTHFLYKFKRDKITVKMSECYGLPVKNIEYIRYLDSIRWRKLDKVIKAQRNHILCGESISLPKERGYRRFHTDEYKRRLCINTSIGLLSNSKRKDVKVGLIDNHAEYMMLPKYLLKHTDSLCVVTKETDIYKQVAENVLEESGAPFSYYKTQNALKGCKLIIAPFSDYDTCITAFDTVILATEKPKNDTIATVIYDYSIPKDKNIEKACPQTLDSTYFASALYTIGKVHSLGTLLPRYSISENKVHTISSLTEIIDKNLT
ncbi:MAG: hypothetical protein IKB73_05180 [Ruminococcus sp.]|nr:hypothetical protein [Ruminococcus sp.]